MRDTVTGGGYTAPASNKENLSGNNPYYTQVVGTTGKTQAQLDAQTGAAETATIIGGKVDPTTGYVIPPKTNTSTPARTWTASDGQTFTDQNAYAVYQASLNDKASNALANQQASSLAAADAQAKRQSAYDLLYSEFKNYGLESLVAPLKGLITSDASPSEFTIKLRETPEYQKRFAANAQRIANGLTAIDEATYLAKEDAYQNVMRKYGLPDTYWKKDAIGTQEGFTKLLANDVAVTELEDRLIEGKKVMNATAGTREAIKRFFPNITDGEILAYVLDPKQAIKDIQRKVAVSELGGAAIGEGLSTNLQRAEELYNAGVTADKYQQAAPFISQAAERGSQLADMYQQEAYNQATAEAEALGLAGSSKAAKQRKKLTDLATASFSGSSGVGALGRDRANPYGTTQSGYGQY